MLTNMNDHISSDGNGILEIIIQGIKIRLLFSAEQNMEAPVLVREILKSSYLRRQSA